MALIAKDTGGGDFELAPAGNHVARCYSVVDMGLQERSFQGVTNHKQIVRISWELCNEPMADGRPFSVSASYTLSLSEKSNLRRDLQSWRGRAFTEEELRGFDLFTILGVPAMVNVVHETKGDRTYANVAGITPLPKGMVAPELQNEILRFSLDDNDELAFNRLPEWLQKKINLRRQTPGAVHDSGPPTASDFPDDDIPF